MTQDWLVMATATSALMVSGPGLAADVQAGRTAAAAKCAQCHAAKDWEGEDAPSLEDLIREIVAGEIKHKTELDLSPSEIADIAAYWGQGESKK